MKKFTYLATMLLVMAEAVSCEKKAEVKEPAPQPTGEMRPVTISAGQATEKTSVFKGNLTWSEGDKLSIVPTAGEFEAVALYMSSEPGTAYATFQGFIDSAIEDDTQLYGWAGGNWAYNSGAFTINMPATQTYKENGLAENAYPSIGKGTINDKITLGNPFGVLCLNVKGETTDKVKSITIESAANNLAGVFTVSPSTTPASVTGGSSNTITLSCATAVALAADGVKFYTVVPAASYGDQDLTVTVTKSDDTTFEVTLGATTVTASSATTVDVEDVPARPACQEALDADANWVQIGGQYWLKENTKCIEYDTKSEAYAVGITTISTSSDRVSTPYYTDPTTVSKPSYMTDEQFGKLGLLYNWAAAVGLENGQTQTSAFTGNRQGICPNGSHVPSVAEWNTLRDYLGGKDVAGKKMKTSTGWQSGIGEGDNGFAALPAGYAFGSSVYGVGRYAYYWSSDAYDRSFAYYRDLGYSTDGLYEDGSYKDIAYSVRCLRD